MTDAPWGLEGEQPRYFWGVGWGQRVDNRTLPVGPQRRPIGAKGRMVAMPAQPKEGV